MKNRDNLLLVAGIALVVLIIVVNKMDPSASNPVILTDKGYEKPYGISEEELKKEKDKLVENINQTLDNLQQEMNILKMSRKNRIAESDVKSIDADLAWLNRSRVRLSAKRDEAIIAREEVWNAVKHETDSIMEDIRRKINVLPERNK